MTFDHIWVLEISSRIVEYFLQVSVGAIYFEMCRWVNAEDYQEIKVFIGDPLSSQYQESVNSFILIL